VGRRENSTFGTVQERGENAGGKVVRGGGQTRGDWLEKKMLVKKKALLSEKHVQTGIEGEAVIQLCCTAEGCGLIQAMGDCWGRNVAQGLVGTGQDWHYIVGWGKSLGILGAQGLFMVGLEGGRGGLCVDSCEKMVTGGGGPSACPHHRS